MFNIFFKPTTLILLFEWLFTLSCNFVRENPQSLAIRMYTENLYYWEFNGKPILLLGGTDEDNLFNHPHLSPDGLQAHLDLLVKSGGNYVRNTMSHRDSGNIFAYKSVGEKFDLERWNDEYWDLFDNFLKMTAERDIIVQLELWDPWDFYRDNAD